MSVNVDKIRGRTRELRMTDEQVAKEVNMHPTTYYRKLNTENGENFTLGQAFALVKVLRFTKAEAVDVFFSDELA